MSSTIFYIFTLIIIYLIIAISFITFTEHFAKDTFEYIFFKNDYIEIDTYTFIHFAVALIIAFFYPFYLDGFIMTFFVVGWDILENYILPAISDHFAFCKETPQNIFTDWIVAIPAILYAQFYRNNACE